MRKVAQGYLFFVLLGLPFGLWSQQESDKEIRRLGNFTKIENTTDFELIFTDRGGDGTLIAQGSKNARASLLTTVEDGALKIASKPIKNHLPKLPFFNATLTINDPLKVVISCPNLNHYITQGEGSTVLLGQRFQNLKLEATGIGIVHLSKCRLYSLDAKLNGAGTIEFSNCDIVDTRLQLEGKGQILAHDLRSKNTNAVLFGEGKITTWATDFLDAKVIGKGQLLYRGHPPTLKKQTQHGGVVDRYFPTTGK
jgi:hypothetical protein